MKKFFSLLAIVTLISVSNCTRIPENNDPVLGIWSKTQINSLEGKQESTQKEEWIFNDAYLGRYHFYLGESLTFYTDFRWSSDAGVYSITYNEEELQDTEVIMNISEEHEQLEFADGGVFAIRE
ncbi:hypothetical protein [Croceitalea rosinachiae]|uniref:Lipocalin-like domain-containing protein n=1 Tax=Croceitalea rosinachiae TaxID=3075596 RepID=A0ABU3AD19_9FLAO|nr:hypothetical protein [Croceitalea sp. F388]MDT0608080.1 hypothetical protein [Croceitalea sp. F388]